jgi:tellurite resistance protein/ribosomal protein L40E
MADKVANDAVKNDDAERALARAFAIGLPILTVLAATAVTFVFSVGPALLVLAAGMLLGVIGLFWASLRTLSGEAPLSEGLVAVNVMSRASSSESPAERKRRVLQALKDLEHEHAVGKIDDADFAQISARYREDAKTLMREADIEIEPLRARAEEIARAHLSKKGLADGADEEPDAREKASGAKAEATAAPARITCAKCSTSNEPDATFCKKCGASLTAAEPSDATA